MTPLAHVLLGMILGLLLFFAVITARDYAGNYARAICGYVPHPISDVAWELVDRGMVPPETALYYSRMMRSDNIPFTECMGAKQ